MNDVTRILIVEDNLPDFELAQREISKSLEDCEFQRVQTRKDYLKALKSFHPDLILSDYYLPGFDGMKALKLAHERTPLTPLIIWTGSISEDIAVDCMKAGANNYVLKENIKRLGPAVVHALEERNQLLENKRAEEKYQAIFENSIEGIFQSTPDGRYLSVNPAMARIYGYESPEEMLESITDISSQVYVESETRGQFIELLQTNDNVENFEMKNFRRDGSVIWTSTSARVVRDEFGNIQYYEGILQDITRRKQVEEKLQASESRYRLATQATRDVIWEWNPATNQLLWTENAQLVFGYSPDEIGPDAVWWDEHIHPEDRERVVSKLNALLTTVGGASVWSDEYRFQLKNGSYAFIHDHAYIERDARGRTIRLIGAMSDITERKQAQENLAKSEKRFRALIENGLDSISLLAVDGTLLWESPAVTRILDYAPSEFLGRNIFEIMHPDDQEWTRDLYSSLIQEPGSREHRSFRLRHSDGTWRWVEAVVTNMLNEPSVNAIVVNYRDITERKEAEEKLRESEEKYRLLFENNPLPMWIYDLESLAFLKVNDAAVQHYGYSVEEFMAMTIKDIRPSEEVPKLLENITTITPGINRAGIWQHRKKDGTMILVEIVSNAVEFTGRRGKLVLAIDVTERKQAEAKLRESENRLILALSAAQMSVWEWNLQTNDFLWSPELYEITGITESTFDGTFDGYTDLIHPQDVIHVRQTAEKAVADNTMFEEEFRIIRPDGEVRWLSNLGHAEYGRSDTSLRMIGTVQDITQRKQAEMERQALLEIMQGLARTEDLQEFLELLHRSIGKVIHAENFFVVFHNRETGLFEEIYSVDQYDPPAPPSKFEKSITSFVFRNGEPLLLSQARFDELVAQDEVELIGTNSASWLGAPLKTLNETIGVMVVQDYENPNRYSEPDKNFLASIATQVALALERKQAEEKVRESEERYRALFEDSPLSIWEEDFSQVKSRLEALKQQGISDLRAYFASNPDALHECAGLIKILNVNTAAMQMYRANSKQELIEGTMRVLSRGEQEHNIEDFIAIAEGRTGNSWEGADETLTGDPIEISLRWSVAPGHKQDFSKVIVTVIDITERKRAEQELHASEERFRQMADNIEEVFWMTDARTGRELYMSPASEKVWGRSFQYLMQKPNAFIDSVLPDDQPIVLRGLEREKNGEKVEMEYRITRPDGAVRWVWDRAFPIFDESGEVKILAGIAADVTRRKQAEEALRESEERFSNAFEFAPIGIALVSLEGRWIKVNRSLCDLLGYSEAELAVKTFQEITHHEDLDTDLGYVKQMLAGEILSYQMEKRYIHKAGEVVWVLLSVSLVKDGSGKPQYFISQIQDITQRRRAEEELRRRAEETSALLETSLALTNLDLNAILQSIGNSAKTIFTADGCRIFLMQPDGESLRCVLALQESSTAFSHLRVKLGEGVTGAVAASGQAEIVNDMQNDPRAVQVPGTVEEEEAIMFAPLRERDRTLGVLSVRRTGPEQPFESADLELLEAFASMAASAVSNARLFEEAQRRLAELEALYENGLAVGQLLEPRQIGERIIDTFARHLSWHHVAIRLVRAGTDEMELIAFNQPGLNDEKRREVEHHFNLMVNKVGQGMSGWVVHTGQPIRTGNVHEHPQYVHTYQGIQSGLYMPLSVGERVIGVISVESEEPDALTAQDERLLATLANQAAIAFENARLYQAAQQEITERKRIEEELRESQERYQLLIETSPDGIIMMNMDGTIRFSNLQMTDLFALENPAELLGTNIVSLFSPEDRAHIEQNMGSHMFEDEPQEGHWLMRKDGSRFFGELRSSALRNEKGEQYAIIAQLRDVTERKHSQEALQEERQKFLDLFENSPNPTWLEDFTAVVAWMEELRTQGVKDLRKFLEDNPDEYKVGVGLIRILNVNHAAMTINGARDKQELIDKVHELLLEESPSHVMIYELDMIWQGHTSFGFEMSTHKMDRSLMTGIQRIYIPINNNRPDYARVIVTSTDITERVEIERKLRASELHYRELADSITDVLFELDHELHYTHWNKASEVLMGIPAYDAIGKSMYEVLGESEEQARIGKIYNSVLEDNQAKTFETEIVIQEQRFVFEINANPSLRGVSVVARNITERKLSEILMQKRFELMEYSAYHSFDEVLQKTIDVVSELTASHIGFMHFIEEDQTTVYLQAWSTETVRDYCTIDGEGMHYPVEQAGVWADAVRQRRSLIHNDYESLADRKGTPDGHVKLIREMVIPITRNDRIVALMGVGNKTQEYTRQDIEIGERFADYAWDITERKQMEIALAEERNQLAKRVEERTADLSRANSNLARALRVKDEFLANMSHELRTPLNAILGLSESLGEQVAGPLNEKQQRYLSTINESGHHLLSLINDILDLAKIEAGQITLDINKVDVNSVCQASLRMIKQLAQKKNQEVVFEIDNDLGLMWADERRLKQMIVNLLSNAVKFTPESARIGLEVRGDRAANKVIITVWDTGIGIRERDLERLFKPFVQLDTGLAREATGTGLGLALVAQMARLHGGSVHAISQTGDGSRFIIQLPWEPALTTDIVARLRSTGKFRAIDPNANRPTILLIEDTREVVMMLVDYLEMAGYKMITAQDGIDGLAQAKLSRPDLILMDIQMPRMDGFEATQKLRGDPEFKDIPIIALTALAMPNDRQRCLDAGMDEYMSKPVNLKALAKMIQKLLLQEENPS
jgi:PAS domain S-box-containing protein